MWNQTNVSRTLGIDYPILQGPFGGNLSSVKLVSTVSNLGGMGGYGAYMLTPEDIISLDKELKQATNKPYNINLWISDSDFAAGEISDEAFEKASALVKPFFDELGAPLPAKPKAYPSRFENQVEALLTAKPPVFSFIFGVPSETILEDFRKKGIKLIGNATTLDEALALENAGVDVIIASGFEAGGHRPSFLDSAEASLTGTFVLVQQIRDKVKTPVVAAGGIADARGVAAAFTLGAEGVQIGTAFLATEESGATEYHRNMLHSDAARYTTLTRVSTGRLGRGIRSRYTETLAGHNDELLPFPLQNQFIVPLRKAATEAKQWDLIMFWSGQIAPVLKHTSAKRLFESIVEEVPGYLK
ncbi:nitronate monooxygenase [Dyadobacter sp. CY261]|uniref:NAD(P)H-dependent flavin oxidoreductase n=1 Tax=Dyadobacter sp. CY261 TaxID=2907203 RepID=UPI001F2FD6D6|nr:nitronate monooxygenase [Dyadobacter sp. CY261]MCF0074368.1 nitronate monooxygenase [Dyadobacter sp. CY261]